jgi:hypothetical protein
MVAMLGESGRVLLDLRAPLVGSAPSIRPTDPATTYVAAIEPEGAATRGRLIPPSGESPHSRQHPRRAAADSLLDGGSSRGVDISNYLLRRL